MCVFMCTYVCVCVCVCARVRAHVHMNAEVRGDTGCLPQSFSTLFFATVSL